MILENLFSIKLKMESIISNNSTHNSHTDYSKYCFMPMRYKKLISFYERQRDSFWVPSEINMSGDRKDWASLNENERRFLTFVLAFFAQADGIVIENLISNFQKETSEIKEANAFYCMQNAMEMIHNETYSLMIDTFIQNLDEKNKALNAIDNYPSIKKIADWMMVWMRSDAPLLERVIAFACVEGIFFTSAFCAIYWIKRSNKLKGLCKANEFIARDEALHTEFAIALYHHYTSVTKTINLLSQDTVHSIIKSAIAVSEEFVTDALKVDLIGMSTKDMIQYVKCAADYLVTALNFEPIYNVENPFDWMTLITLTNKTNFFEDTVSEYSKTKSDFTFDLTVDF